MPAQKITLIKQFTNLFTDTGRAINNYVNKGNFHGFYNSRTMNHIDKLTQPTEFFQKKLKDGSVMVKGYKTNSISSIETYIVHPNNKFEVIERPSKGVRRQILFNGNDHKKQDPFTIASDVILRKNATVKI